MSQAAMSVDAFLAQAGCDRLAGLAEADETDAAVSLRGFFMDFLRWMRCIEALDIDDHAGVRAVADPLLVVERLDAEARPLRPSIFVTSAVARNVMPTGVAA